MSETAATCLFATGWAANGVYGSAGSHDVRICGNETITSAQNGVASAFGERVGEAVTEVEPRAVAPPCRSAATRSSPGSRDPRRPDADDPRVANEPLDDIVADGPRGGHPGDGIVGRSSRAIWRQAVPRCRAAGHTQLRRPIPEVPPIRKTGQ